MHTHKSNMSRRDFVKMGLAGTSASMDVPLVGRVQAEPAGQKACSVPSGSRAGNILLILTDQHRYDIVGANGSTICRSPNLDKLAEGGVNFQKAYTICPLCSPSRASIYTGLTVHNHGIVSNVWQGMPNALSIGGEIPTIAERLNQRGYHCEFVGKWHAGKKASGECGFEGMEAPGYGNIGNSAHYLDYLKANGLKKPDLTTLGVGYPHNLILAGKLSGPVEATVPYYLAEKSIEQIRKLGKQKQPFFFALNFWGPHAPYLPCEPYASMYKPEDIPPWGNFYDDYEGKPPIYQRYNDRMVGEGQKRRSWAECAKWAALYFGFATMIDDQIGRVLKELENSGLVDNTSVIFSADHGDFTGCHGGLHDKGPIMCEEVAHIPLIIRMQGVSNPGRISKLPVSNLDIPATIMELAGEKVPESFDGRSMLPILKEDKLVEWPDYVVAESKGVHFSYETRMVVHGDYKYVFHHGAFDELYNLKDDPWEMKNLINSRRCQRILLECRRRLLQWTIRTKDPDELGLFLFLARESKDVGSPYNKELLDITKEEGLKLLGES